MMCSSRFAMVYMYIGKFHSTTSAISEQASGCVGVRCSPVARCSFFLFACQVFLFEPHLDSSRALFFFVFLNALHELCRQRECLLGDFEPRALLKMPPLLSAYPTLVSHLSPQDFAGRAGSVSLRDLTVPPHRYQFVVVDRAVNFDRGRTEEPL